MALLAKGSYGIVKDNGDTVIKEQFATSFSLSERLFTRVTHFREVAVLQALKGHPNIVEIVNHTDNEIELKKEVADLNSLLLHMANVRTFNAIGKLRLLCYYDDEENPMMMVEDGQLRKVRPSTFECFFGDTPTRASQSVIAALSEIGSFASYTKVIEPLEYDAKMLETSHDRFVDIDFVYERWMKKHPFNPENPTKSKAFSFTQEKFIDVLTAKLQAAISDDTGVMEFREFLLMALTTHTLDSTLSPNATRCGTIFVSLVFVIHSILPQLKLRIICDLVFELCSALYAIDKRVCSPSIIAVHKLALPYSEEFLALMIFDMLMAIDAMHSLNFVHRDIKPNNIMISKEGRLKICDFGVASIGRSQIDDLSYTKEYRAPEIISRNGKFISSTKQSDVWAIGFLIYVLVTLDMYNNMNRNIIKSKVGRVFTEISKYPSWLSHIVKSLASEDARERDVKKVMSYIEDKWRAIPLFYTRLAEHKRWIQSHNKPAWLALNVLPPFSDSKPRFPSIQDFDTIALHQLYQPFKETLQSLDIEESVATNILLMWLVIAIKKVEFYGLESMARQEGVSALPFDISHTIICRFFSIVKYRLDIY